MKSDERETMSKSRWLKAEYPTVVCDADCLMAAAAVVPGLVQCVGPR